DVRNLQNTLNSLGYNAGSADGIFGKNTKNAVMSFQKNNNLSADGIVGPATLSKLNSTSSISKETSNRGSVASRSIIEKVIATAQSYLGVPYVWGGTSPSGFDCSGFTYYVLKQYGISIPRTSTTQYTQGTPVSKSNLQRGDFVFFNTSGSGVSHVGIYLGNNTFISATSSKGIAICSLNNSYWSPRYIGARRILY
ncbi:NlpC/P60 family protein, partial [Garciella nitratireducens]